MSAVVIESTDETRIELDAVPDPDGMLITPLITLSVYYDPAVADVGDVSGFQCIALNREDVEALVDGLRKLMPGIVL